MAAIAGGIAAAAIAAAGSVAGAEISAHGAAQAAKRGSSKIGKRVPLPAYATAINTQMARETALNAGTRPPSFADYVASGGTANTWIDPGTTPKEAKQLGLVDARGMPISRLSGADAAAGRLSTDQMLFLADWLSKKGRTTPLGKIGTADLTLQQLQALPNTPRRDAREEAIKQRIADRLANLQNIRGAR